MTTNIKTVIKSAIASRSYTQDAVAKKAGWEGQSALSTAINRKNPSLEAVFRILDALEYDIVIKDRNSNTSFELKRVEEE
jgi:transcriptional regulator with XRE-family HTH domain